MPSGTLGLADAKSSGLPPRGVPTADGLGTVELDGRQHLRRRHDLELRHALELANVHAAGTGAITFASGAMATLKIHSGMSRPT